MVDLYTLEWELKALANRNRLRILQALRKKRHMTVSEVAKLLRVSPSAASQTLRMLADGGIIKRTKRGLFVSYRLAFGGEKWIEQVVSNIT